MRHSRGVHIDVAVVGSLNLDLVAVVDRLPLRGETVSGDDVVMFDGGKGGNQAVAAARAGARVALVGCVGYDDAGSRALAALADEGVDTTCVLRVARPTGMALIAVDREAGNQIVVSPGANAALDAAHVLYALAALEPAAVVTNFEVPPDAVAAAAEWCGRTGARLVLNPSPARPIAPSELPAGALVVCNEIEVGIVTGSPTGSGAEPDAVMRARAAADLGAAALATTVVVTLGADGAVWAGDEASGTGRVPAPAVTPLDTTGAGDCLTGVLAAALAGGRDLPGALRVAVAAASASTTVRGARGRLEPTP